MVIDTNLGKVDTEKITADTTMRQAAVTAGLGLTLMMVLAIFATSFVLDRLIVPGDAAATVGNILENEQLIRIGILSITAVIFLDMIVAWALYVFLKPVNPSLSLLAGWIRLAYAAIFAAAMIFLVIALGLLTSRDYAALFTAEEAQSLALLFLNAYRSGWAIALAFFGPHLMLVGYLGFRSGYMPKLLGILVLIAGLGYVIDAVAGLLVPDLGLAIGLFTFIGEPLLGFWLLFKGFKAGSLPEHTIETARGL